MICRSIGEAWLGNLSQVTVTMLDAQERHRSEAIWYGSNMGPVQCAEELGDIHMQHYPQSFSSRPVLQALTCRSVSEDATQDDVAIDVS